MAKVILLVVAYMKVENRAPE
ncbi:uncharacterized protein G2W53_012890 [Senna tora]|uniref:Uncharacterized protein n=1 Tax=Senna tora TaxID=362788 RepID=A0A834WQ63_9FABA|nr:uncharacterized protein G2W53_012890 [Senna tora]